MLKNPRIIEFLNPWLNPSLKPPPRLLYRALSQRLVEDHNSEWQLHRRVHIPLEWNGSSRALSSHVRRNRYRRAGSIPQPATVAREEPVPYTSDPQLVRVFGPSARLRFSSTRFGRLRATRQDVAQDHDSLDACTFRRIEWVLDSCDHYPFFVGDSLDDESHVRSLRPTSIGKITIVQSFFSMQVYCYLNAKMKLCIHIFIFYYLN